MVNSVVEISFMSAKYFEYYIIVLRGGRFFVDTLSLFHRATIKKQSKNIYIALF